MSTTIERRNGTYILTDNGVESTITSITTDGKSLVLPENASGRKFFALSKFEKSEIHDLIAINRNPDAERTITPKRLELNLPKSHEELHEYCNDKEKDILLSFYQSLEIYNDMMKNLWDRLHPKKESLTEEQKLRNKIARLQAQLEAALANEETQA